MKVDAILECIEDKINDFEKSSQKLNFEEAKSRKFKGVYVIYEDDRPIYVGSTGRLLKDRMRDLTRKSKKRYKHTLTRKLLEKEKRFGTMDEVKDFYSSHCSFKVIKTDNVDEARMLEHVLIMHLRRTGWLKYNK